MFASLRIIAHAVVYDVFLLDFNAASYAAHHTCGKHIRRHILLLFQNSLHALFVQQLAGSCTRHHTHLQNSGESYFRPRGSLGVAAEVGGLQCKKCVAVAHMADISVTGLYSLLDPTSQGLDSVRAIVTDVLPWRLNKSQCLGRRYRRLLAKAGLVSVSRQPAGCSQQRHYYRDALDLQHACYTLYASSARRVEGHEWCPDTETAAGCGVHQQQRRHCAPRHRPCEFQPCVAAARGSWSGG